MRNRRAVIISLVACVVFGFFAGPQKAQITIPIFVGNTSDIVVPAACAQGGNTANCSLRGAIEQANASPSNSIIRFAIPASDPFCSGTGNCTIKLLSALPSITEPASIIGPGADKLTVARFTADDYRVFAVTSSGTVSISGLTIAGGATSVGGGILHAGFGGTLNVTSCWLVGNNAIGTPISSFGGGIANQAGGTVNVVNSVISGGRSFGESGTGGGGIYNEGILNITNSTISDNSSGNGSGTGGGGIRNFEGTVSISNSTITGNTALGPGGVGGGIVNLGGKVVVKSSIIALNDSTTSGPDVSGNFISNGFNLIGKRNGSMGFDTGTDQTGTIDAPLNPLLRFPSSPQNNGGLTRTIALQPGSPAIDKGTSNALIGPPLTIDQRGIYRRTFDNTAVANAVGGDGTDIGAFELQLRSPADFDGDHKTDVGILRPVPSEWWIYRSSTGATFATQFGATTDKLAPGDYTGDGSADIAFWRPSTGFWFVLRSEDFSFFSFPFGTNGDVPAPADYDGDGKTDAAVFRPSSATWFIRRSLDSETTILAFGANGDNPVPADYDGDGRADIAIFRPSVGQWWLNRSAATLIAVTFGNSSDKPVPGDYTGDGKSDVAFWRPSTGEWFVLRSENSSFFAFAFGTNGDIPAPGDYDGDGRHDATVFRPSSATWFSQRTTAGTLIQQFGAGGDRPIPNAFVP